MHPDDIPLGLSFFKIELPDLFKLRLIQVLDGLHFLADNLNVIFRGQLLGSYPLFERDQPVLCRPMAHGGSIVGASINVTVTEPPDVTKTASVDRLRRCL